MAEEWQKRVLPYSAEAEKAVLGAMLIDKDAISIATEVVTGEDFYIKQNQILFETMVELNNSGKPVDPLTLKEKLIEKAAPPEICEMNFVMDIVNSVYTSANVKAYAKIVSEKAVLRRLIKVNAEIENSCYAAQEPLDDILGRTEREIFAVIQQKKGSDYIPISVAVNNQLDKIGIAAKNKGTVTGLSTGFIDLDYKTAGLQNSDLIIIAARPSMGKTAFTLNIAQAVAIKQKKCMAIFSLEMSREQLVNRMFSLQSGIDAQKLRTGALSDAEWEELINAASIIGDSKLIVDDTPGISIQELRSKCRKYKIEHDLSLVMIDYLQLMSGNKSGSSESRQQEISEISRALKSLARELNIPVIALSQLSRAVESRPDHRPMLSDLRESGGIEQDADVVMFIYRDEYYTKEKCERKGVSEIIIAKQRNGPIGTVELAWIAQLTKFGNLAPELKSNRDE